MGTAPRPRKRLFWSASSVEECVDHFLDVLGTQRCCGALGRQVLDRELDIDRDFAFVVLAAPHVDVFDDALLVQFKHGFLLLG
jgi:hypothetical protein